MEPFYMYIDEYRNQLEKGHVREAYKGLMEYINSVRLYLKGKYPEHIVSDSIQRGYMDYTYFYFFPKLLRDKKLKVALFFVHESFAFEIWLAGYNREVQGKYLKLFTSGKWNKYGFAPANIGNDYIIKHVVADNPDFSNPGLLIQQIESKILEFIDDVLVFLSGGSAQ